MAIFNEDREQIALFTWIRANQKKYPLLGLAYHTPNGGNRDIKTAAKLKAMGTKRGVWDVYMPLPLPGLWVEMKVGNNKLTVEQAAWRKTLSAYGHQFYVAYNWIEAARRLGMWAGMPEEELPR